MADPSAGMWPAAVACGLATVVVGLADEKYADERMPLSRALEQLSGLVEAARSAPDQPADAQAAVSTPRDCVVCEEAPRDTRLACGHSACCSACIRRLVQAGGQLAACPVCKEPSGISGIRTHVAQSLST